MLRFSELLENRRSAQPEKYHKNLSPSTQVARAAHFDAMKDKEDDDEDAYEPAPGDAQAKTKPSQHTKKYKERFESNLTMESFGQYLIENKAVRKKAKETGISYSILKQVYDRGVAAWKTGHRPGTTPQQWGLARVNSFATGGKTRRTADKDLWKKHSASKKKKKMNEEVIMEAEYQGKKVKLNDPIRNSGGKKKFRVYTTHPKTGNVIKVEFGDTGLSIKRDSDKRRKAFRARHGCDAVTFESDRHTPKYWSCKMWTKSKKVSDLD